MKNKSKYYYYDNNGSCRIIKNIEILQLLFLNEQKFIPNKNDINNRILVIDDSQYFIYSKKLDKLGNRNFLEITNGKNSILITTLDYYEYKLKLWCHTIISIDEHEYSFMEIPEDYIDYEIGLEDRKNIYCKHVIFKRKNKESLKIIPGNNSFKFFDKYIYIGDNPKLFFKDFDSRNVQGISDDKNYLIFRKIGKTKTNNFIGTLLP